MNGENRSNVIPIEFGINQLKPLSLKRLRWEHFEGNWEWEVRGLTNSFETHTTNVQYSLERSRN